MVCVVCVVCSVYGVRVCLKGVDAANGAYVIVWRVWCVMRVKLYMACVQSVRCECSLSGASCTA